MKVLPVRVLLVGAGNSIHLQRWANALVQAGLHVACATVHTPLPEGWDTRVALQRLKPHGGAGYALAVPALRRLIRHGGFDLVHAHYATGYGLLATLAGARPRLVSVWGSDVDEFPELSPLHAWLLRRILMQADALAATSQALVRRVQQLVPRVPPLYVTPFGVDTAAFAPANKVDGDEQLRERPLFIGTRKGLASPLLIGTSKGLAATYGIDILLRAFALLPACAPDGRPLRLRLLGTGPQAAAYQDLSATLGLQHRVEFAGGITHAEMPAALQQLDIFVAPSRQESFGVSVLEASACAKPVVASRVGGLPEVVQHGVTGLLVPPNDVPALAAALKQLVQDAPLRAALGAAGRLMVEERYRWDACVDTMVAAYREIIAAGSEGAAVGISKDAAAAPRARP